MYLVTCLLDLQRVFHDILTHFLDPLTRFLDLQTRFLVILGQYKKGIFPCILFASENVPIRAKLLILLSKEFQETSKYAQETAQCAQETCQEVQKIKGNIKSGRRIDYIV